MNVNLLYLKPIISGDEFCPYLKEIFFCFQFISSQINCVLKISEVVRSIFAVYFAAILIFSKSSGTLIKYLPFAQVIPGCDLLDIYWNLNARLICIS